MIERAGTGEKKTGEKKTARVLPNTQRRYEITRKDLPAHCPTDEMSLWNSHPRVYFPLKNVGDEVTCPYCSAVFELVEK